MTILVFIICFILGWVATSAIRRELHERRNWKRVKREQDRRERIEQIYAEYQLKRFL